MENKLNEKGLAPFIIVIVLLVVASSWVAYWRVSKDNKASSNKTLASLKTDLPSDVSSLFSVDKIRELATAEKADAVIKQVELEMINNVLVYKVQLADGTLLAFNAKDGSIVTLSDDEKSESEEDSLPTDAVISITFEKAIEVARTKFPEKTIHKVELELENGKVVYSIRFTDGSRVDIDAGTGEIAQAKDSVVEDKDKDDDGIEDEKEASSGTTSSGTEIKNPSSPSSSSEAEENELEQDDDDSDEDEDKIEYKDSSSEKEDD